MSSVTNKQDLSLMKLSESRENFFWVTLGEGIKFFLQLSDIKEPEISSFLLLHTFLFSVENWCLHYPQCNSTSRLTCRFQPDPTSKHIIWASLSDFKQMAQKTFLFFPYAVVLSNTWKHFSFKLPQSNFKLFLLLSAVNLWHDVTSLSKNDTERCISVILSINLEICRMNGK